MKAITRQTLSVLLALALVSTAMVAGLTVGGHHTADVSPVGTAEASHNCGQSIALNLGLRSDLTTAQQAANVLGSCNPLHGDRSNETIDHNQTQTELIQRGATANEQSRLFLDSLSNNLGNTRAVARLEAQGEYYRQLESGASESAARVAAKDAVRDYYTTKQKQLASSWNILIKSWDSYEITANAEGLGNFVGVNRDNGGNKTDISLGTYKNPTLINGSSDQEIAELHYKGNTYQVSPMSTNQGSNNNDWNMTLYAGLTDTTNGHIESSNLYEYRHAWLEIQTQNQQVLSDIDDYIDQTYSEYQQGDINASDIVSANALMREYTGDNQQSWSTLALSSTSGVDPPDDLDGIASMTVAHGGSTYEGILLADTEEVDKIATNTTYNGSTWAVTPQVVTDSSYVKLDGEFTVTKIKTADGSTVQNRTYREVDYQTTNTTEYRQLMGELDALRAELEAREQQQSGGPLIPSFGLGGGGGLFAMLGVLAAVLLLASGRRNRGRGGRRS
jgi:hypothetical protein